MSDGATARCQDRGGVAHGPSLVRARDLPSLRVPSPGPSPRSVSGVPQMPPPLCRNPERQLRGWAAAKDTGQGVVSVTICMTQQTPQQSILPRVPRCHFNARRLQGGSETPVQNSKSSLAVCSAQANLSLWVLL